MKVLDVQQGSPEWAAARAGLPTASAFSQIITDKGLKPSAASDGYLCRLLAEWLLGVPLDDATSGFMQRGTAMEAEAAAWYEFQSGVEALPVGLCLTDDGAIGASPDRLVGDDGLLEIKCPGPAKHVEYMEFGFSDYRLQVQGQLWVTGRKWVDKVSYHPVIRPICVRVARDPEVMAAFDQHLPAFASRLAAAKEKYAALKAATADAATDSTVF